MYDKAHINVYKSSNLRFEYHQTFLVGCSLVPCYDLGNLNNVNAKIIELLLVSVLIEVALHVVVHSRHGFPTNPRATFGCIESMPQTWL